MSQPTAWQDNTGSSGAQPTGADELLIGASVPMAAHRSGSRAPLPFVWQHDRRLLLLDDENGDWVLAELQFEPELCRYVEVRRATYEWAREAVGAVIARALASGIDGAVDAAISLESWLAAYHGVAMVLAPQSLSSGPNHVELPA